MNRATRQISLKKNRGFEQQYKPVRPNKIYIYRIFHPTTAEHTFFSSEHGTFSRIEHMLDHNKSINNF